MRRSRGGPLIMLGAAVLGFIVGVGGLITALALALPYTHDPACDRHPGEKFSANAVCTQGYRVTP